MLFLPLTHFGQFFFFLIKATGSFDNACRHKDKLLMSDLASSLMF